MKLIDLTGKTIGNWQVLKRLSGSRKGESRWLCKCKCGLEKSILSYHLRHGRTKQCQKCAKKGKNHPQWKGCGEISGNIWDSIKRSASGKKGARKKLDLNITLKFIWDLFIKQNRKCALSGIELIFPTTGKSGDGTASLDRIDSSLGYTKDNVQWVHKDINFMKRTYSQEYFIDMCKKVSNYHG